MSLRNQTESLGQGYDPEDTSIPWEDDGEPVTATATLPKTVAMHVDEYMPLEANLEALRGRYEGLVFDCRTVKGIEDAKLARRAHVKLRSALESTRKQLKGPALDFARLIDTEAKRIEAAILQTEEPIDAQIKGEERRKEAEKQAKAQAEARRVEGIRARIEAVRLCGLRLHSDLTLEQLEDRRLKAIQFFGQGDWAEFTDEAERVKNAALSEITTCMADREARIAREEREAAERAKFEAERKEAARLAKIESDRLAAERAKLAEERRVVAEAQAKLDAERLAERKQFERELLEFQRLKDAVERKASAAKAEEVAREHRLAEKAKLDAEWEEMARLESLAKAPLPPVGWAEIEADDESSPAVSPIDSDESPDWTLDDFRNQVIEYKLGNPEISFDLLDWAVAKLERLQGLEK